MVPVESRRGQTHIEKKHSHCTPIWITPSKLAKQATPLISEQHATSSAVLGKIKILTNADVPDVQPSRMK